MENAIELKFRGEWRGKLVKDILWSIFFGVLIGALLIKNITKGDTSTFHMALEALIVVCNGFRFFYSLIEVTNIEKTNYIKIVGKEVFIHRSKLTKDIIINMENIKQCDEEKNCIWVVDKYGKRFKININAISSEDNSILKEYIKKFIPN